MDIYNVTNASGQTLSRLEVEELLQELGISDDAIRDGTSDAIEADAQKQNITNFDKKLTELAAKGGEVKGSSDTAKEDYNTQLIALGIPDAIIAKGSDAVKTYADANGIKLPLSSGTSLNFKS